MPWGLSRHSQPWIGSPRDLTPRHHRPRGSRADRGALLGEQRLDARGLGERAVGAERQIRRVLEPHPAGHLAAQLRGRALQRLQPLGLQLAAELGHEHHGVAQIRADAHLRIP